jgi:hypothetical protein
MLASLLIKVRFRLRNTSRTVSCSLVRNSGFAEEPVTSWTKSSTCAWKIPAKEQRFRCARSGDHKRSWCIGCLRFYRERYLQRTSRFVAYARHLISFGTASGPSPSLGLALLGAKKGSLFRYPRFNCSIHGKARRIGSCGGGCLRHASGWLLESG